MEIERGASFAIISGIPVLFYGNLPKRDAILIASYAKRQDESARELYVSSFEASLEGFEIVAYGELGAIEAVLRGAEDGAGRIHLISSIGLSRFRTMNRSLCMRILLTGGSIISSAAVGSSRNEARYLCTVLSRYALAVIGARYLPLQHPLLQMLDEGKEIAILLTSLASKAGRDIAFSGCPVASSFSAVYSDSRYIVYPSPHGRFSFLGFRYDFMRLC